MITIRELTMDDMEEAAKLQILCWTEELAGRAENTYTVDKVKKSWVDWINSAKEDNDERYLIGAFENEKLLGVSYGSFADTEDIPENGVELNGLWVYPEHRGKGISIKLIKHIINHFKAFGRNQMVIYNIHYAPSNKFYRKFGATVIRNDEQMGGKLLIDLFQISFDTFLNGIDKSLVKYEHFYK